MAASELHDARSPSPVPTAPTQQTPGPRATALTDLYAKALTATLRTCSYENFAACFPTPAARTPRVLRAVWEQICGKIETKGHSEFEQILAERQVVPNLNALEALVTEAKGRREAGVDSENHVPPHQLPPADLLAAHLAPQLTTLQAQLMNQLNATRMRNLELANSIYRQRDELEQLVSGLEAALSDLEGANRVLEETVENKSVEGTTLREEIKTLRGEIALDEGQVNR